MSIKEKVEQIKKWTELAMEDEIFYYDYWCYVYIDEATEEDLISLAENDFDELAEMITRFDEFQEMSF